MTCDEEVEAYSRFLYVPPSYVDQEDERHDVSGAHWRTNDARQKKKATFTGVGRVGSNNHSNAVKSSRNTLVNCFCSEVGEVDWQYRSVGSGYHPNTVL